MEAQSPAEPAEPVEPVAQGVGEPAGTAEPDLSLLLAAKRTAQGFRCQARTLTCTMHMQADAGQRRAQALKKRHECIAGLITGAVVQLSRRCLCRR
jgi:hypothetical protein